MSYRNYPWQEVIKKLEEEVQLNKLKIAMKKSKWQKSLWTPVVISLLISLVIGALITQFNSSYSCKEKVAVLSAGYLEKYSCNLDQELLLEPLNGQILAVCSCLSEKDED